MNARLMRKNWKDILRHIIDCPLCHAHAEAMIEHYIVAVISREGP